VRNRAKGIIVLEQSNDTQFDTERVLISMLRGYSVARKISFVKTLSESTIHLSKRAIARANKDIDEEKINLIFIELHYGKKLSGIVEKYLNEKSGKT
jgi:hypothetical protein